MTRSQIRCNAGSQVVNRSFDVCEKWYIMKLIVFSALLLSGCASWTHKDTQWQKAYFIALSADALTTTQIQYHPDIEESVSFTRQFLGPNPSTEDTLLYFVSAGVIHTAIAYCLPPKWRRAWQITTTIHHGYLAVRNCRKFAC